jgi:small subunit ribosomal protein S16
VVADARAPRDGAFIEVIGHYNPLTNPETIVIDGEKALSWLKQGAQPTAIAARLLSKAGITEKPKLTTKKAKPTTEEPKPAKAAVTKKSKPAEAGVTKEAEPVKATVTEEPKKTTKKPKPTKVGVTKKAKPTKKSKTPKEKT